MPELPDLEVYKENICNRLRSRRLEDLAVFNPFKVRADENLMRAELAGRELLRVGRAGKELLFDFGEGRVVAAHLMLNGEVSILPEEAVGAARHKTFALRFARETVLFSDRDALCAIRYRPPADKTPDAFSPDFTLRYFRDIAKRKARANVKAFLIDQKVVKGIGNAYADEILWAARISPHSVVGAIPEEQLALLYEAIGAVLREAVVSIKSIAPDIISGEERSFLKVHNKALKRTETGCPIRVERIVSKITYHTEEQVIYFA